MADYHDKKTLDASWAFTLHKENQKACTNRIIVYRLFSLSYKGVWKANFENTPRRVGELGSSMQTRKFE